ncbi:hypothetical protein [Fulvivirga ligni]|uniref:hypothetical protein n=1 Tax=Fulvivirga ligni TaxID=2904246 RepID=UPI001F183894|nr:hypothetical protein [Fulvivirga ligni]UII20378.1 hypothetical protein LVD16_21280 [Fulvivirga ligni]
MLKSPYFHCRSIILFCLALGFLFSCNSVGEKESLEERALSYFIEKIYNSESLIDPIELINGKDSTSHYYVYEDGLEVIPHLPDYFTKTNILKGFRFYSSGEVFNFTKLPIHPDSISYYYSDIDEANLPFGEAVRENEDSLKKQVDLLYPISKIDSYYKFNELNLPKSFYISVCKSIIRDNRSYVQISCVGPQEGFIYEKYNFFIVFDSENRVEDWFITVSE